ncbi:hypothetical protein HQ520_00635 [bacterium]|nr:hypothetical protein [bacterium]
MKLLAPLHDHCPDPKRKLHYDEFCAWLLIYSFTPILDSMRGLQQVSDIESLRQRLKLPRFSLGSFSEAAGLFDPALLAAIIEEVGECLDDIEPDRRLRDLDKRPVAADGTLLNALPKMVWALWRDDENRAAKHPSSPFSPACFTRTTKPQSPLDPDARLCQEVCRTVLVRDPFQIVFRQIAP